MGGFQWCRAGDVVVVERVSVVMAVLLIVVGVVVLVLFWGGWVLV